MIHISGMVYLPPAAITSIVVVAVIVIVIIVVRSVMCVRNKRTCGRCRRGTDSSSVAEETETSPYPDNGLYQQPPEYQECVNNPLYRKPTRVEEGSIVSADTASIAPPSYDRVEKGEYKSLAVSDKAALKRLRHQIMAKSREAFSTSMDDTLSTIAMDVSVYAEISEHNEATMHSQTTAEISPIRPGQRQSVGIVNQSFCASVEDVSITIAADGSTQNGSPTLENTTSAVARTNDVREPDVDNLTPRSAMRRQVKRVTSANTASVAGAATIARVGSNTSSSSIPKYSDLIHPPTYANLSFCDDQSDIINPLKPADQSSEARGKRPRAYHDPNGSSTSYSEAQAMSPMEQEIQAIQATAQEISTEVLTRSSRTPAHNTSATTTGEIASMEERVTRSKRKKNMPTGETIHNERAAGASTPAISDNHDNNNTVVDTEYNRGRKGRDKYRAGTMGNQLYRHESDKLKAQIRQQRLKMKRKREREEATTNSTTVVVGSGMDVNASTSRHVSATEPRELELRQHTSASIIAGDRHSMPSVSVGAYPKGQRPGISKSTSCTHLNMEVSPTNTDDVHRKSHSRHAVAAPYGTFSLPRHSTDSMVPQPGSSLAISPDISRSMPCLFSDNSTARSNKTYQLSELVLDPSAFRPLTIGASRGHVGHAASQISVHKSLSQIRLEVCSESTI